jgi:hypothetical protein
MKYVSRFTLASLLILAVAAGAMAQNQPKPIVPVKVQVVVARYEGDKKISSMPYTLSVTGNGDAVRLRMGSQIPLPTTTYQGATNSTPVTTYAYHNVGTNIDCSVKTTDDGRYNVFVGIEDSSVVERRVNDAVPTLRNFINC